MLGWTGKDKPLKLGAPMTKEEREAADKPAPVMQWSEVWNPNEWTVTHDISGYIFVDPPVGPQMSNTILHCDALAGQLTASE